MGPPDADHENYIAAKQQGQTPWTPDFAREAGHVRSLIPWFPRPHETHSAEISRD